MKFIYFIFCSLLLFSCKKDSQKITVDYAPGFIIRGADLSFLPEIENYPTTFYNQNGVAEDALTILKDYGCNTIRLRLWHTPSNVHSSFTEVLNFSNRIHHAGLKVLLDLHYSDTWTDPGHQSKPAAWTGISFNDLKDSVYNYTKQVVSLIHPDFIQIGNELNGGFLWGDGNINQLNNFTSLLKAGTKAVRDQDSTIGIILHYAGYQGADWFYGQMRTNLVDYDIIGLSYYPMYHGYSIDSLTFAINNLISNSGKKVMIVETSYPFTLSYNDYTNNILGLNSQLIPAYPATIDGQRNYLFAIRSATTQNVNGLGFCYWGTEWVAFKGPLSTNGSSYENQALFDFNNKALPAMDVFNP